MLRKPRKAVAFAVIAIAALTTVGVGVGLASIEDENPDSVQSPIPMSTEVEAAFAVFRSPAPADPVTLGARERLSEEFSIGPDESPVAHANFDQAQPVEIANSSVNAWIAPSGNQVCTFIPDPVGGDGASCATMDLIESGLAITIMGGGPVLQDEVIVVVLAPDGASTPTLEYADDTSSSVEIDGNAAAVLAPASATLRTSGADWALEQFTASP